MNAIEPKRSPVGLIFFLVLIAAFVVVLATLLGLAMIVAVFLHWIWPRVDWGTWIIASLIGTGFTIHFLARTLEWVEKLRLEDSEPVPEETVWVLGDYLPPLRRQARKKKH